MVLSCLPLKDHQLLFRCAERHLRREALALLVQPGGLTLHGEGPLVKSEGHKIGERHEMTNRLNQWEMSNCISLYFMKVYFIHV